MAGSSQIFSYTEGSSWALNTALSVLLIILCSFILLMGSWKIGPMSKEDLRFLSKKKWKTD